MTKSSPAVADSRSSDKQKGIRLQKFLADAGIASRRKAEGLITGGRVRVNGTVVRELGTRVQPGEDRVEFDGSEVHTQASRWVAFYKPPGCLTTRRDPGGRKTIYDVLPSALQSLRYVGRLDMETEGLLLLTTNGDAIQTLTHPKFGVDREYLVWVKDAPKGEVYTQLREGVELEDGLARVNDVRLVSGQRDRPILALILREGRKREVRRLMEAVGHPVQRLKRIRFDGVELGEMKPGEWRDLTSAEISTLTSGSQREGRSAPSRSSGGRGHRKSK